MLYFYDEEFSMKLSLIGTGNVAFVLSRLLMEAGHSIVDVHGRNTDMLNRISELTGAKIVAEINSISNDTDLCLLAVSDAAIKEVAAAFAFRLYFMWYTPAAPHQKRYLTALLTMVFYIRCKVCARK